jgi:hypothetical protein
MKHFIIAIVMFTCLGTARAQGPSNKPNNMCGGGHAMAQSAISEILEAHNKIRQQFKLSPLSWNCKLAEYAQEWAVRGVFEHREDNFYGENIFVTRLADFKFSAAVDKWFSEQPFWDNKLAACQTGKICNHFTQLVWKTTAQVGCGLNRNASGKWSVVLVCDYDPAGNFPGPAY